MSGPGWRHRTKRLLAPGLIIAVIAAAAGAAYYFGVAVRAGADVPASLVTIGSQVLVAHAGGSAQEATPTEVLARGDSASTDATGWAVLEMPGGAAVRLAPRSAVVDRGVDLTADGGLGGVTLDHVMGTLMASTAPGGEGPLVIRSAGSVVTATRAVFEVASQPGGADLRVFEGSVDVEGPAVATVGAGQELTLGATRPSVAPIAASPADPFLYESEAEGLAAVGNDAGSTELWAAQAGGPAAFTYVTGGGDLTALVTGPAGPLTVTVAGPDGSQVRAAGTPPVRLQLRSAGAGVYRATVALASGMKAGTPYFLAMAAHTACVPANIDASGVVRLAMTGPQLAAQLVVPGLSNLQIAVRGPSSDSAQLQAGGYFNGVRTAVAAVLYASPPGLAASLSAGSLNGVPVASQDLVRRVATLTGVDLEHLSYDFTVDRLYSCSGPSGGLVVVEGHR